MGRSSKRGTKRWARLLHDEIHEAIDEHNVRSAIRARRREERAVRALRRLGENGMPELSNAGLGSNLLALSQLVRGGDPSALVDKILHTRHDHINKDSTDHANEIVDLVVLIFVTRNARGGKGEKKQAYDMFLRFARHYPETAVQLLGMFPHYGYWKDLFLLLVASKNDGDIFCRSFNYCLVQATVNLVQDQLVKDLRAVEQYEAKLQESCDEKEQRKLRTKGPSISFLAKWLPREGSSLDKETGFVKQLVQVMWPAEMSSSNDSITNRSGCTWKSDAKSRYRRTVAKLTSYLALPEVLLAAQKEDEIRFQCLASKATMQLRKVMLNEDTRGRRRSDNPKRIRLAERFIKHVVTNGAKGRQLMPHEIVSVILEKNGDMSKAEEQLLDAQWKDLWRGVVAQVEEAAGDDQMWSPTRMVPMADVSGSMMGVPMEVSIALSLGLSEITHEAFRHMVLTFDSTPRWHRLNPGDTIVQKVRSLQHAPWGMSTNFEAAYDLILETAEKARLRREDLPTLIVFSDMQFDEAARCHGTMTTMHEHLRTKVRKVGMRLGWEDTDPTPIVYWNLRNTRGHPVDKDTEGSVLLAGFSPSLLKLVMQGDALREETIEMIESDGRVVTKKVRVSPWEVLRKMLDDKLYDPVREILAKSGEGKLREYKITDAEHLERAAKSKREEDGFVVL